MRIKSLDPDVVKKLRSDIAFSSVAQCVAELVWNSVDSGANCIAVRLNLPFYKIQVIDNGSGIPSDQMALVGNRYSTSKCHTLEDLQNLQYGGFRGEALASLKEVASNLMIESRTSGSLETYCKIFTHGKASGPSPSINSRPSKGTTVTVFDFMYNRPVRKQSISEAIDLEETRRLLQSVALVHPHISFSLQSESTGEMCLQFRKCSSVFFAFMELFGKDKGKNLKSVESEFEGYSISGCISTDSFSSKDYQFLYVNKRLIRKTSLHKLINSLLNKAFSKKQLDTSPQITSPSKNQLQYCAFVLDIACSRTKYDAVFDHKTTMVEFTEWDKVSKLVEFSVSNFLRSEHLISSSTALDEQTITNPNYFEACNGQFLNLGIDYFKNGLFSHAAKRREDAKEETKNNLPPAENANAKISRDCNLPIATKSLISNSCCDPVPLFTEISNDKSITMDKIPHYQNVNEVSNENPIDKSYICLKNVSNTSVLDTLKVHTKYVAKNNNNISSSNAKVSTPSSVETHVDIPCRSVFPIQSPVMLRVPTKSTLSQLQKKRGDSSMMLKIKEKYVFSSKKTKKFSEKPKEITRKVVDKHDGFKNNDQIKFNQYELPSLVNKQCKNTVEIKTVYKTSDKKSHISKPSSMVNKKTCRITSKYKFLDDTQSAPLKRLQHKNKQKKLTTFLEDKSDLNSFGIEFEHSKTFSLSPLIEASTSIPSSPDIFRMLEKQGNTNDDQSSLRQNYIFEGISPINTISEVLTKDNPKLHKHKKCHSSHSANIENSTSSFSETKTSNFFLTSFNHNKRKINDISPKEKRSLEEFSLPNLNQTKSTELHNENIESNCNDPNKSGDFLLQKFQTSTELVTPHAVLNAKKLKTTSTFTDSSESVIIEKQQSNQNTSDIINTNRKDDTNLLIVNDEQNASLAYTLFHNLDKDICLPDITESKHISEFYNSGKSKVIGISENGSKTLIEDQTNITESSCELSPTVPFETNHYSTTCNNFFINQPGILNDDNRAEKQYLSTTSLSPDRDLVLNSEIMLPENMLLTSHKVKSVIPNESMDLSPSNTEPIPFEKEINFHRDFVKEISSDVTSKVYGTQTQEFNVELENCSQSSVSSNIAVKSFHEGRTVAIKFSPKEKISVLPDNEMETSDSDNSASVAKTPFWRNINKYDSSSEFHEPSLNENNNETGLSCIQISEKANCSNSFNNELRKRCDNDADPHCLSNEPLNPALCEMSDKTSMGNSEYKTAIENCDALSSEVKSSKIDNDRNETKGSRWIRQVNEETKRVAYIDSVTGNSTYVLPEVLKDNEASSSKEKLPETLRKKSHFFLTHDFSPFVRSTHSPKKPDGIDDTCDLQNDLHRYIDHEEVNDWHRKWRYPLEKADSCDDTIQDMFGKWENPMFDIAPEMNDVEEPKVPVCLPHMYFLNSYRFNSSSLNGLKVIGQVDCKFIASIIQDFSDNYKNRRLLTLFDQHAVHERIRLEELTDDLHDTKEDGRRIVKFQPISPPLKFKLELSEVRLLRNYHASLQELGIFISIREDTNEIEVNSLPVCLVKDGNQLRRKADEMSVLVEKIIKEWLSSLMRNRGVSSLLPRTLTAVLNSQACRGAVKFGDPLDLSQCENLLTSLSHCKLPFQCAHGRPSIAPILDLNKLATITKKRQPPQLWKLREQIQKQSMV